MWREAMIDGVWKSGGWKPRTCDSEIILGADAQRAALVVRRALHWPSLDGSGHLCGDSGKGPTSGVGLSAQEVLFGRPVHVTPALGQAQQVDIVQYANSPASSAVWPGGRWSAGCHGAPTCSCLSSCLGCTDLAICLQRPKKRLLKADEAKRTFVAESPS